MENRQQVERRLCFAGVEEVSDFFEDLLLLEHNEEVQQAKEIVSCRNLRELVARGFCVSNLHLESQNTGIHGRHLLHFTPGGGKGQEDWLRASTLKQGDIVAVRSSNDHSGRKGDEDDDADVSGVVWKIGSSSISIALDEASAHGSSLWGDGGIKGKFSLVKLANDVTYRRYRK